jgi:arabinofuranosyltransferase
VVTQFNSKEKDQTYSMEKLPLNQRSKSPYFNIFSVKGLLVLFLIGIVYLFGCLDVINIKIDDVFITLRYVRNLLSGNGLVFNLGERVEGFSNPTWLFSIALFAKILNISGHFPMLYLAKILGVFLGFCTLIVFFIMMKNRDNQGKVIFGLLFLIAINPFLNVWNISGLETPLVNFLLALVVMLYLKMQKDAKRKYVVGFSIALGLLSISRPEGIIYPISIFMGMFLAQKITKAKISSNTYMSALIAFMVFFGYLLFRWLYYQDIFPNTLYAKNNPSLSTFKSGLYYTIMYFGFSIAPFLFLTFIKTRKTEILQWLHLPLYLIIFAQYSFAIYAGGDWMPGFRFLLPILPISYFLIVDQLDIRAFPRVKLNIIFLSLLIIAGSTWVIGRDFIKRDYQEYISGFKLKFDVYSKAYYDLAKKLSEVARPSDLVLIGEAGLIPYFNDQIKFIDLYGLMDRHMAKEIKGAHSRRIDNDYFFSVNFTYFVAIVQHDELIWNQEAPKNYTGYYPVDAILNDRRFFQNYIPVYNNRVGMIFKKIKR